MWKVWHHKVWCHWMVRKYQGRHSKKVMFETLPESRRNGNGWKMTWQFILWKIEAVSIENIIIEFVEHVSQYLHWIPSRSPVKHQLCDTSCPEGDRRMTSRPKSLWVLQFEWHFVLDKPSVELLSNDINWIIETMILSTLLIK